MPLFLRYILILLVPFIMLQFAAEPLAEYKFNQELTRKSEEAFERIKHNAQVLKQTVIPLQKDLSFTCNTRDKNLLSDAYASNPIVSVAGLFSNSGVHCSTLGDSFNPHFTGLKPLTAEDGTAFSVGKFKSEVALTFNSPRGELYLLLTTRTSPFVANRPCEGCFYIESHINGFSELSANGIASIKQDLMVQEQKLSSRGHSSHVHIWAGNALHAYANRWAYQITLLLGLIVGLFTLSAVLMWQQYHSSPEVLLKQGISRKEFKPVYQQIVDARTGTAVGYEALLRWHHKGENVVPGTFIDMAENTGLIMPLTEQLLDNVIGDLKYLSKAQWVTLNIVAAHLETPALIRQLESLGWPGQGQLQFELTERKQIRDVASARQNATILKSHGYGIKIDDFGAGFGGMASLQQLDFNAIKIDKMFVDTIGTDDPKVGVLDSMINFGHDYPIEMIAEGVETAEQADYLLARGVWLQQGFLYGRPKAFDTTAATSTDDRYSGHERAGCQVRHQSERRLVVCPDFN